MRGAGQKSRGKRKGNVFAMRLEPAVRAALEAACAADSGPKSLGPWLVWRATADRRVMPARAGNTPAGDVTTCNGCGTVFPPELGRFHECGVTLDLSKLPPTNPECTAPRLGNTPPADCGFPLGKGVCRMPMGHDGPHMNMFRSEPQRPPVSERVILDLCAGSGSWSEPYRAAGYQVRRLTLPQHDVRVLPIPDEPIWGILAAPPCTEFSLAKNGQDRDFRAGLEVVSACLRLVMVCEPQWWVLENPVGLLGRFLGQPADSFEPHEFGDPWTKRTALWGRFNRPARGPHVRPIDGGGPLCSVCHPDDPRVCSIGDHRAVTPPGFARAFFEANP